MMIDTSIFVPIFRDASGQRRRAFRDFLQGADYKLSRLTQLELLQGAASDPQWQLLDSYLAAQDYAECDPDTWAIAARYHFDLRRAGKTVRSIVDCCIAEVAIRNRLVLVHNDRDFDVIATVSTLRHYRLVLP